MPVRTLHRAHVLLVALLLGLTTGVLVAQGVTASQVFTITTTASAPTNVGGLTFCRGVLEGGSIRIGLDGSTPTSTVGRPVYVGERLQLNNPSDIRNFKAIATTTTTTTISLYCGAGTAPDISVIESPPTSAALPVCNALTRQAGNCR